MEYGFTYPIKTVSVRIILENTTVFLQHIMNTVLLLLDSHADVLRGSSRVRGTGTRDEPLRTSAWEAILLPNFKDIKQEAENFTLRTY